jgi:predicted AlkP superfamily phosphohydrolase/phosphomutase
MEKAANYVLSKYRWDLFMMQWHPIDFSEHQFFQWDPACFDYEKDKADYQREIIDHCYELMDGLVGSLMRYAAPDTLFAVISDHGITASSNEFMINNVLINAGLLVVNREKSEKGEERLVIDWSKTKAFALYGWGVQIYVNLKGRDPQGIVEPGREYEQVREEIIHLLHNIQEPKTKERPVVVALRREDAMPLLHCGPNSGDVIYALKAGYEASAVLRSNLIEFEEPHYGGVHSSVLPNGRFGTGTLEAAIILTGAGVKKNRRREKAFRLVDFAPTLAFALGVPAPAQADGAVVLDLFE